MNNDTQDLYIGSELALLATKMFEHPSRFIILK